MSLRKRKSEAYHARNVRYYPWWKNHCNRAFNRAVRREGQSLSRQAMAFAAIDAAEVAADKAAVEAEIAAAERESSIQTEGVLRLWSVKRTDQWGYDHYSQAVVVAMSEDLARRIHPSNFAVWNSKSRRFVFVRDEERPVHENGYGSWTDAINTLEVKLLGDAAEGMKEDTVVCASFHAG